MTSRSVWSVAAIVVTVVVLIAAAAWLWQRPPSATAAYGGDLVGYEVVDRAVGTAVVEASMSDFGGRVEPQALWPVGGEVDGDQLAVVPPLDEQLEWAAALELSVDATEGEVLLVGFASRRTAGYRVVGVESGTDAQLVVHVAKGRCLLPCGDEAVWNAVAIKLPDRMIGDYETVVLHQVGPDGETERATEFVLDLST